MGFAAGFLIGGISGALLVIVVITAALRYDNLREARLRNKIHFDQWDHQ